MHRLALAIAFMTSPAWAVPADCPVMTQGKKGPITGTKLDSWQAVHTHIAKADAPSEAAAIKALCEGASPCGASHKTHVLSYEKAGVALVLQGHYEVPANKPYYMVYGHLDDAFTIYEEYFKWTVRPLGEGGSIVHAQGVAEIIGREEFCEPNGEDCRTASVTQGYEVVDLVFRNQSFLFGAACMTDGDETPEAAVQYAEGTFGYRGCSGGAFRDFKMPHKGGCEPALITLKNPKATLNAGRAAAKKKKWHAAIASFDQLVGSDPTNAAYRAERGYLRIKAMDYSGAEADLREALKHTKDAKTRGMTLFNLGLALEKSHEPKAALEAFEQSEAARPHKAARSHIEQLKRVLSK
jgi:tetratricopeptide (TPR) repeat protein